MRKPLLPALALVPALVPVLVLSMSIPRAARAEGGPALPAVVEEWHAGNEVSNRESLQKGLRDFVQYCLPCHSMKYVRWSRVGDDLKIPPELLATLMPPTAKPSDYIQSSLAAADGVAWFGKQPPDLSLMARSRGPDRLFRFLKGFYADGTKATGSNNVVLDTPAMPAVLSELQGVQAPVYVDAKEPGGPRVLDHFEKIAPGQLTDEQFDAFVRDTVNFLDYAGEPAQVDRRSIGVWVVLFLLVFTWLAWLLKKEYWKDVH